MKHHIDKIVQRYCGTNPKLTISPAHEIMTRMMCVEHELITAHPCEGECKLVFKRVKRVA